MKVSVITCTWNSRKYLPECIASVRAQDHADYEHIFVDGGSTDGTLEEIQALDGPVKWVTGIRGGISRAMNEGVKLATGAIISHLHSDDAYAGPRTLSTVVSAFKRHPGAVWLVGRCLAIVDGEVSENDYEAKPILAATLIRRNLVPHPSTFIRREAFDRVGGFDTRYKYAMDYDMWLKLIRIGPPVQLVDYLSAFRYHEGSLSTANVWAAHNEALRVRLKHVQGGHVERAEHLLRHAVRSVKMACGAHS